RQALKSLDRDEAVDLLELGPQLRGEIEIILAPARAGLDLENDGIHRLFLSALRDQCSGFMRPTIAKSAPSHNSHIAPQTTARHGPSFLSRASRRVSSSISRSHCRMMCLVSRSAIAYPAGLRRNAAAAAFY